ncbi:MAG: FAD:protein FMN transferase [Clostridia bacterium]|nr:FAD:protein FMN transferase [Clostridia bacterium]
MKRFFALLSALLMLLTLYGCDSARRFQRTFIDYFDTAITIIGYEENESDFNECCNEIEKQLKEYHQLFDIYNSYDGINNIYTVNSAAGKEPIVVDSRLIDFLLCAKNMYEYTNGQTNIAMGRVLRLWHDCRTAAQNDPENAKIPEAEKLNAAANHSNIDNLIIDSDNNTVFLSDPEMLLDVGCVAKGYAMQKVYEYLQSIEKSGYALNFGGMVRTLGTRSDGSDWTVAIESPTRQSGNIPVISPKGLTLSTSGSYQRYYEVGGIRYHHIIDPDTLKPENTYLSVSVLSENCMTADALSTAIFNMSPQDAVEYISKCKDIAGVMLVMADGSKRFYGEFESFLVK